MNPPHLLISAFIEQPLFSVGQINKIHQIIMACLPKWAEEPAVARYEDDPHPIKVRANDNLLEVFEGRSLIKHGLGSATLLGAFSGINFFLRGNKSAFPSKLSCLSVEIVD